MIASLWWFTFFEDKRTLRGAVFVHGRSFDEAHTRTTILGCNLGGETVARRLTGQQALCVPDHCRNRVLDRDELRAIIDTFQTLNSHGPVALA